MMNKATFAGVLLLSGAAFAQTPTAPTAVPPTRGTLIAPPIASPGAAPAASVTPANLSGTDKVFVQKAAEGGLAEVQAAQLAQ